MATAQVLGSEFSWNVDDAGYEWKKGADSKLRLCGRNVPGTGTWTYKPLVENPGLFRNFAELCGKEEILQFANQYGVLFDRYSSEDRVKEKGTYRSIGAASGTTLVTWAKEIGDMGALIAIWDSTTNGRIADLKHIVSWRKGAAEYRIDTPKHSSSEFLTLPGESHFFKEGDVLKPARYALQREINKRLSDEFNESDIYKIACVPRLLWDAEGNQRLTITPPNLLGAMWLQFAQFASGAYQLKRCAGCGQLFRTGAGGRKRADAITCSDACRQRKRRESVN